MGMRRGYIVCRRVLSVGGCHHQTLRDLISQNRGLCCLVLGDDFFEKRGKDAFEWYGEFKHLQAALARTMDTTARILNIGLPPGPVPTLFPAVSSAFSYTDVEAGLRLSIETLGRSLFSLFSSVSFSDH